MISWDSIWYGNGLDCIGLVQLKFCPVGARDSLPRCLVGVGASFLCCPVGARGSLSRCPVGAGGSPSK
jgi:hypothetical protein